MSNEQFSDTAVIHATKARCSILVRIEGQVVPSLAEHWGKYVLLGNLKLDPPLWMLIMAMHEPELARCSVARLHQRVSFNEKEGFLYVIVTKQQHLPRPFSYTSHLVSVKRRCMDSTRQSHPSSAFRASVHPAKGNTR